MYVGAKVGEIVTMYVGATVGTVTGVGKNVMTVLPPPPLPSTAGARVSCRSLVSTEVGTGVVMPLVGGVNGSWVGNKVFRYVGAGVGVVGTMVVVALGVLVLLLLSLLPTLSSSSTMEMPSGSNPDSEKSVGDWVG